VAALDHPNVVAVYDTGEIGPEEGAGRFAVGTPWLAMQLAPGGSLFTSPPRGWDDVEAVLLALLAALAHAHAHGVLHLDLKPDNVLRGERGAPLLADFGLATLRGERVRAAGTPLYVAPEVLRPRTGPTGPWTDLYALGWMAWTLAGGVHPWADWPVEEVLRAHLGAARPLPGQPEAPSGFLAWVARLVALHPRDRFANAAEAARHLRGLGRPISGAAPRAPITSATWSTVGFDDEPAGEGPADTGRPIEGATVDALVPWTTLERGADWSGIHGVGLGLFPWRTVPLVARTEERDALWSELAAVVAGERRAVALVGPEGSGRSRLASWVATRAEEAGVARAVHVPADAIGGLREAVAGASRAVVVVDDVSHDGAIAWSDALRAPADHLPPTLLLLTAREAVDGARTLVLGELSPDRIRALTCEVLGLAPELATRVVEGAEGLPGRVIELMSDLVRRDVLERGATGYRLTSGVPLEPARADSAWEGRLRELLGELGPSAARAVHVLAAASEPLSHAEWASMAGSVEPVARALVRRGWIDTRDDRYERVAPGLRGALAATDPQGWEAAHELHAERSPPGSARRAAHLLACGRRAEGASELLLASRASADRPREALALAARWRELAEL
ncbi:MAG: hypothetical protein KC621_28670, partial [Myxococcales bacterium]|nr:hypothetical protein [Myxococcales bacterium]